LFFASIFTIRRVSALLPEVIAKHTTRDAGWLAAVPIAVGESLYLRDWWSLAIAVAFFAGSYGWVIYKRTTGADEKEIAWQARQGILVFAMIVLAALVVRIGTGH